MDLYKLSTGERISAVSGVLLFVFMFFDWFGVEVSGVPGFSGTISGVGGSAWDALDVIPIFLGLLSAAGIAYGGYSAMREEGVTFGDAADRLGGGPPS